MAMTVNHPPRLAPIRPAVCTGCSFAIWTTSNRSMTSLGIRAEEMLDAADSALYAAKRQERGSISTKILKPPLTADVQTQGKQWAPRVE